MHYIQKSLPLEYEHSYNQYDFVVSRCNLEAYNAVTKPQLWPHLRLLIIGEKGSGKTHLANIWQAQQGAIYFHADISNIDYTKPLIIENTCAFFQEHTLLHIMNTALEHEVPLLMTASKAFYPSLPDLKSRINATYQIFIKQPDIDLIKVLLAKQFHDKQLLVPYEVIDYISTRITRSFQTVRKIVAYCEQIALEQKRSLTLPLTKTILEEFTLLHEPKEEGSPSNHPRIV